MYHKSIEILRELYLTQNWTNENINNVETEVHKNKNSSYKCFGIKAGVDKMSKI